MTWKKNLQQLAFICLIGTLWAIIFTGISVYDTPIISVNNTTVQTFVNVTNTEPMFQEVNVSPSIIDLNPGGLYNVSCVALINEFNGFNDHYNTSAKFWQANQTENDTDDNNYHYTVGNSSCTRTQINSTFYWVNCSTEFQYYANNDSWNCSMRIYDNGGAQNPDIKLNQSRTANRTGTVSQLLAIDVPSELQYGNLTVTQTSSEMALNVTNFGNVGLNASVRIFANMTGSDTRNLSMNCTFRDILVEAEKYSKDPNVAYASKINSSNLSTMIQNYTWIQRTNDSSYQTDRNATYWQIQIPLSVGGLCGGFIQFVASIANT